MNNNRYSIIIFGNDKSVGHDSMIKSRLRDSINYIFSDTYAKFALMFFSMIKLKRIYFYITDTIIIGKIFHDN